MAEAKTWRKTFAFSKRDEATLQWWDSQENPSVSLQLLIREEVERNGFTDKLNAPVSQLPRRGRPPKEESEGPDGSAARSDEPSQEFRVEAAPQKLQQPTAKPAPTPEKPTKKPAKGPVATRSVELDDLSLPADPVQDDPAAASDFLERLAQI